MLRSTTSSLTRELLAKHIIEIMLENTNRTLTSAAARLRLYNTATHNTSEFTTVTPGHAGMYVCGATAVSYTHLTLPTTPYV